MTKNDKSVTLRTEKPGPVTKAQYFNVSDRRYYDWRKRGSDLGTLHRDGEMFYTGSACGPRTFNLRIGADYVGVGVKTGSVVVSDFSRWRHTGSNPRPTVELTPYAPGYQKFTLRAVIGREPLKDADS